MADNFWLGGDPGNETSWSTQNNWTGGVPTSDDHVFITGDRGGSYAISGATVTAPARMFIDREYNRPIASSASPLILQTNNTEEIHHLGPNKTYIQCNGVTWDGVSIRSTSPDAELHIFCDATGTVTRAFASLGKLIAEANANITNLIIGHLGNILSDAHVTIEEGADITNCAQSGGKLYSADEITTSYAISGGEAEFTKGNLGTVWQSGGSVIYDSVGGTVTLIHLLGGTFDTTQSAVNRTITDAIVHRPGRLLIGHGVTLSDFTEFGEGQVKLPTSTTVGNYF